MKYGRPRKYDDEFMRKFIKEWKESRLSLRAFCKHQKVPYVSIQVALKRLVDKKSGV